MKIGTEVLYIGPELVENYGLGVFYRSPKNGQMYTIKRFAMQDGILIIFLNEHCVGTNIHEQEVGIPANQFEPLFNSPHESFVIGKRLMVFFIN